MEKQEIIQYDNGYISKTPIFQFILLSCLFPLWAAAASLNDVLITQSRASSRSATSRVPLCRAPSTAGTS